MNKLVALYLLFHPYLVPWANRTPNDQMHVNQDTNNQKILSYWNRRSQKLSQEEWHDFYCLIVPVLMRTRLPSEYADPAARQELVQAFFFEKVFENALTSSAGELISVHALHEFLHRFSVSLLRKKSKEIRNEYLLDGEEEEKHEDIEHIADVGKYTQVLREAGIKLEHVDSSAEKFVNGLNLGEKAYLRNNTCAEHEESEPISHIAKRLALSSYHYKAKKLGVTREKGETHMGYENTLIGGWLVSVGAKVNPEWREELSILISLLCMKVREKIGGLV